MIEPILKDLAEAKREDLEKERAKREEEAYEAAMSAFRKSRAYKYIMEMLDQKIKEATDTRELAKNFGKIKGEVMGDIGVLGVASLMASKPLEEIKNELE
jgi:flagellar biosynthesis/type III secretory pathway protein FliH